MCQLAEAAFAAKVPAGVDPNEALLLIGRPSMRQNDITGAPVRSEPKLGKAWACLPWLNAAADSSSAAVTVPWPPRP